MRELFASQFFNVFMFVSGIASVVSLLVGIWRYRKTVLVLNAILSIALSGFGGYSYFRYTSLREEAQSLERRKALAREEARRFIEGLPSVEYFNAGNSRGVALAGLAFLETQREFYPKTFELAQATVRVDIEEAQKTTDQSIERQRMEVAGNSMLALLRGIAGPETPAVVSR